MSRQSSFESDTEEAEMNEDWQDKLEAQKRHEHLAAVVRIAVGELCYLAEQQDSLAERIYGITSFLEAQLEEGDVAYGSASTVA